MGGSAEWRRAVGRAYLVSTRYFSQIYHLLLGSMAMSSLPSDSDVHKQDVFRVLVTGFGVSVLSAFYHVLLIASALWPVASQPLLAGCRATPQPRLVHRSCQSP